MRFACRRFNILAIAVMCVLLVCVRFSDFSWPRSDASTSRIHLSAEQRPHQPQQSTELCAFFLSISVVSSCSELFALRFSAVRISVLNFRLLLMIHGIIIYTITVHFLSVINWLKAQGKFLVVLKRARKKLCFVKRLNENISVSFGCSSCSFGLFVLLFLPGRSKRRTGRM